MGEVNNPQNPTVSFSFAPEDLQEGNQVEIYEKGALVCFMQAEGRGKQDCPVGLGMIRQQHGIASSRFRSWVSSWIKFLFSRGIPWKCPLL